MKGPWARGSSYPKPRAYGPRALYPSRRPMGTGSMDPSSPRPTQSRIPGLIGSLMAPNGILRASPDRKLRGGVDSRLGPRGRERGRSVQVSRSGLSGFPLFFAVCLSVCLACSLKSVHWDDETARMCTEGPSTCTASVWHWLSRQQHDCPWHL